MSFFFRVPLGGCLDRFTLSFPKLRGRFVTSVVKMPTITTYSPLIPPDKPSRPIEYRSKRRKPAPGPKCPIYNADVVTTVDLGAFSLSPPPTPGSPNGTKGAKFPAHRLRSNSGLAFHTNDDLLKRYTDYYPDGTPRISVGLDGTGSLGLGSETRRPSVTPSESDGFSLIESPIPSFLGRETFNVAMKNPETTNKLWTFAESQGCGHHIEFLAKVAAFILEAPNEEWTNSDRFATTRSHWSKSSLKSAPCQPLIPLSRQPRQLSYLRPCRKA